ncbi:hypothetical protein [Nostoc sp.]|uniref:hypothetical protein n=1 Tax=Nostoc sp. TaxID=1180 RepID=UPI002FFC6066
MVTFHSSLSLTFRLLRSLGLGAWCDRKSPYLPHSLLPTLIFICSRLDLNASLSDHEE